MPYFLKRSPIYVVLFLSIATVLSAQKEYGGTPLHSLPEAQNLLDASSTIDLTAETSELWKTPKSAVAENIMGLPVIKNKKSLDKTLASTNYSRTFLQRITLGKGSRSYIRFRDFELPPGARLFIFSEDTGEIHGAFTHENNKSSKRFLTGPIHGNAIIEYDAPRQTDLKDMPFAVDQVYVNPTNFGAMETGFGSSFECNININCASGQTYGRAKRGVMRILVVGDESIFLCTGSLLNNTAEDEMPYVLTALHCEQPADVNFTPFYDMWFFDFNFEGPSCVNPSEEPGFNDVQGCVKVASRQNTDMLLLRITQPVPEAANAFFNGWDRRPDYLPQQSAIIHHPSGDIKKISQDFDQIQIHQEAIIWNNGSVTEEQSHFISDFDDSVYQPGSSGAALFDEAGRVIGQLHGGPLADEFCTIGIGYSGRLALSWDGDSPEERLKDWLDPLGTDANLLDGIEATLGEQIVQFNGRVVTPDGIAIPNVQVSLSGDKATSFFTGTDGRFVFDGLSTKGSYTLNLVKDGNHANGISATDVVLMMNHIIGRKFLPNVFSRFAGDVNLDGNISTIDLVQLMNVIIGRSPVFPHTTSWRFEPENLQMSGSNIGQLELSVIGFKMGDLNNSANPRN